MDESALSLIVLGVIVFGVGLVMPAEYMTTEEKCVEPGIGEDNCKVGGYEMVEVQKDNDFRAPAIVGGGLLVVVGLFVNDQQNPVGESEEA